MSPVAAEPIALRSYNAPVGESSISGVSSGAFMAVEFGTAWSSIINGVGTGAVISTQERHRRIPARRAGTQKRDVPDQNAIILNVK
jgi:hypothetical protein